MIDAILIGWVLRLARQGIIKQLIVKEPRYYMGHVEATHWYEFHYYVLVCHRTKQTLHRLEMNM